MADEAERAGALEAALEAAGADAALERQRLRRKLFRWRLGGGVLLVLVILAIVFGRSDGRDSPHIAQVTISGLITDDDDRDAMMRRLQRNDSVRAVILRINSPGGSTAGSEALYESIRSLAAAKPVVAVMGEAAASGGYIAAIATDYIVARGNTLTASVGVILTAPNISKALDQFGVSFEEYRSGALKAQPSAFSATAPEVSSYTQALVDESYVWFRDLVAERRKLDSAALAQIADGKVMTGRMALKAGLIDAIGGRSVAIDWLKEARKVPSGLPILEYEVDRNQGFAGFVSSLLGDSSILTRALEGPKLWSVVD